MNNVVPLRPAAPVPLTPPLAELGRQYPYVTPARANAIRREIDARPSRHTTRSTP